MAISDTITSMYENVGNVYDVLELAGADLTNVDKNIENLKQSWEERLLYFLANGTDVVWNNWLPKVNGSGETITLNNTIEAKMDFVYKGNTSQTGTPTPEAPIPINVVSGDNTIDICGKNLLPNSESSSNTGQYQDVIRFTDLEPSTEYTLKVKGTAGNKFYTGGSMPYSSLTIPSNGVLEFTFTTNSTISDLAIIKNTTATNALPLTGCTLCKGSTATYEPYQSQSYSINLRDIELCKIGDYQDYIYKENKKWYKYGTIGKLVLNGSESYWAKSGASTENVFVGAYNLHTSGTKTKYGEGSKWIVNRFTYGGLGVANKFNTYNGNAETGYMFIGLTVSTSLASDLTAFKNWLSANNVEVYYVPATPTITEITDTTLISQLEAIKKSYNTQTNISQTNADKPFILDVVALGELEI